MIQERLPDGIEYRVLGSDGIPSQDVEGRPIMKTMKTRFEFNGLVDYELLATGANLNKEVEFQRIMMRNQTLVNPLDLQIGLQNLETIYENRKDFVKAQGVLDPDRILVRPEKIEKPLSLTEEIGSIIQGRMPRIVMNDDHAGKVMAMELFFESDQFKAGVVLGNIPSDAAAISKDAISKHKKMAEVIAAQQVNNPTGMQISPSLSARVAGSVEQKTGQPLVQAQNNEVASAGEETVGPEA